VEVRIRVVAVELRAVAPTKRVLLELQVVAGPARVVARGALAWASALADAVA